MLKIFRKSMSLSATARADTSNGATMNLIAADASHIYYMFSMAHFLWVDVLVLLGMMVIMAARLGWSSVVFISMMVSIYPVQLLITKYIARSRRAMVSHSDSRVSTSKELLTGIRAIKVYGWEEPMMEKVMQTRAQEMKEMQSLVLLRSLNLALMFVWPIVVAYATFSVHVALGNPLDSKVIIGTLAYLTLLARPMVALPMALGFAANGWVAQKRLDAFFQLGELDPPADRKPSEPMALSIRDGSFGWHLNSLEPCLSNINLSLPLGSLTAVIGSVGSGKTSLLSAMLGEMHKLGGEVVLGVDTRFSYVAQAPWILNETVRENILFGRPYDVAAYQKVVEATGLKQDLKALSHGDETEIGERGRASFNSPFCFPPPSIIHIPLLSSCPLLRPP